MKPQLTAESRDILILAEEQARALHHHFVGTEHLLLALIADPNALPARALQSQALSTDQIRSEILRLVQPIPTPVQTLKLTLTRRAKKSLQRAAIEASLLQQKSLAPEHLLLGLLHEPDGVAGQALGKLGIQFHLLRNKLLKTRLDQLILVERVVRPLTTTTPRKRKIREELLAHLETIYEEEYTRLKEPDAAFRQASERFGNPADLSRELQRTIPFHERFSHRLERFYMWRAPESAAKYCFRLAAVTFLMIMLPMWLLAATLELLQSGWHSDNWFILRPITALLLLMPTAQFLLGFFYLKLRDALLGAFGQTKSLPKVFAYATLLAIFMMTGMLSFITIAESNINKALELLPSASASAVVIALFYLIMARLRGHLEISDTLYSSLDLIPAA